MSWNQFYQICFFKSNHAVKITRLFHLLHHRPRHISRQPVEMFDRVEFQVEQAGELLVTKIHNQFF